MSVLNLNLLRLNQAYLNLNLDSGKETYTRIIERPGRWMTPDEVSILLKDLRFVIEKLGLGALNYGVVEGKPEALDRAILTVLYDKKTGLPFAFNALSYINCYLKGQTQQVVHLGLIAVDPSHRAQGFSWILYGLTTFLIFFRNRFKPLWISNVSQVPAIIGMVADGFGNVFPNPKKNTPRSFDHLTLAREIMHHHRSVFGTGPEAEFDEESFVIVKAYTRGSDALKKTFEQAPKHRNSVFNEFCSSHLDYERGDDFLQIGVVDVPTFYNYLAHAVPKKSILVILYKALFSFLESVIVPIVRWFSPSQRMGVLRSRS